MPSRVACDRIYVPVQVQLSPLHSCTPLLSNSSATPSTPLNPVIPSVMQYGIYIRILFDCSGPIGDSGFLTSRPLAVKFLTF